MKIDRKQLLEALEIVRPGLANAELIDQATSFAFLEDRVVTYNDSISLSHPISQLNITGAIHADELYEFLKRTNKKEIQIRMGTAEYKNEEGKAVEAKEIQLKAGRAKAGFRLVEEIKMPIQETGEVPAGDWEELPEDFASDMDFIKGSTSRDKSLPILTCVHVCERHYEASDGIQIMRINLPPDSKGFPFNNVLLPAENITEITKIEPTQVARTRGWLHFRNLKNGEPNTQLSCRILMDEFPGTSEHFEVKGNKILFPKIMSEILDRVMVFTKKDQLMEEEMQVLLKDGKLMVKGENDYGRFEETAPVKYEGGKASFWITPHLLQNILDRSNKCTLGEDKIKFKGEGWEYVASLREL